MSETTDRSAVLATALAAPGRDSGAADHLDVVPDGASGDAGPDAPDQAAPDAPGRAPRRHSARVLARMAAREARLEAEREAVLSRKAARREANATRRAGVEERKAARTPQARLEHALAQILDGRAGGPDDNSTSSGALSLDREILALVAPLDERARTAVLERWGMTAWPATTLEVLGARYGVTRERMRQVTAKHDELLAAIRPPLPAAAGAIAALTAVGGIATTAEFMAALRSAGVTATIAGLRALVALGALGLVARLHLHEPSGLWLDDAQYQARVVTGELDVAVQRLRARVGRALRRTGFVGVQRLASAPPLTAAQAAAVALGDAPATSLHGCIVPHAPRDTFLARQVMEMLSVTPVMSLRDLARGLRRTIPKPIYVPVPVLREVLRRHGSFAFGAAGTVRPLEPVNRAAVLAPPELDAVELMESRGGYTLLRELQAMLASKGHSGGWMMPITQAPYSVPLGNGRYGLRGRPLPDGIEESATPSDGRRHKEWVLADVAWQGEAAVTLRYRVTPSTRRGALRLSRRVAEATEPLKGEWPVRLAGPDAGPSEPVGQAWVTGGLVWDVSPWFDALGAVDGDHLTVHLALGQREVTLGRVAAAAVASEEAEAVAAREARRDARVARAAGRRGGRPRRATRLVYDAGGWVEVPNVDTDLSGVRLYRFSVPSVRSLRDVLFAAFTDFPLAPGTAGVAMGVTCRLTSRRGQLRFTTGLIEQHLLDAAAELPWAEGVALLPRLPAVLSAKRAALAWREVARPTAP